MLATSMLTFSLLAPAAEPTALYQNLVRHAEAVTARSLAALPAAAAWPAEAAARRRQWRDMLGLEPLPERTPLTVTITGVTDRGGYVIERLHYQPIPGCRIAANLYRPKAARGPLPTVVYVCGHHQRGKFHYQVHPRWFAQHGYVAMILDPIQVGENGGFHHGTYRNSWWHWYSQGYSPAGVEVWAAMRAIDYLSTRPEVDAGRIGITGNSGGGTMSWFTAAADERVKVAVPSCQTGNMVQHIVDRTLDGHCDCSYWVNTAGWDFSDVAALIAPRPLLVASTTEDVLFRPYAFRDLVERTSGVYRLLGAAERIDLVEDVAKHGYTPKTRLAIFNWFQRHLAGNAVPVTEDANLDPEDEEALAVYPDRRPPADDRLKDVDRFFIKLPEPPKLSDRAAWEAHRDECLSRLRQTTFRSVPAELPAVEFGLRRQGQDGAVYFRTIEAESEPGLPIRIELTAPLAAKAPWPALVAPLEPDARSSFLGQGSGSAGLNTERIARAVVAVRGTGAGSIGPGLEWTVRRGYPLVGHSLPERQMFDLLTAVNIVRRQTGVGRVAVFGRGQQAALAIYAALLDPGIEEIVLADPVATHWDAGPEFLGVLRVGDLPHNLALAFPRKITFVGALPKAYDWTRDCYAACGEAARVKVVPRLQAWKPEP